MRLIDADALKEHYSWWGIYPGTEKAEYKVILDDIVNLQPTVEHTGKWVRHHIGSNEIPWGHDCTACGKWIMVGEEPIKEYSFCPHCGAKME